MEELYDAIVVGLGGMGSAALYHLARRGQKVLGLEQFAIPHDRGSSHGLSRIIRLAYHEHPDYVPLLRRAYTLWRELQEESGQDLLRITGCLEGAEAGSPPGNVFENALAAAREHDLPHEVLTGAEVNARFPGYRLPADYQAVFQPDGGILAPERCIAAHAARAAAAGARIHTGEAVLSWSVDANSRVASVHTNRGLYRARRLVLTAGAWMPQLIPQLQALCTVQRQVVGWFETLDPAAFQPGAFPVFVLEDKLGDYYGFGEFGAPGLKIGRFYHLHEKAHPDALSRTITPEDEACLRAAVRKLFPGADGEMSSSAACMFTNTTDHHFILDHHPAHPQVILCSACSGHGFKFCSVIGEILADLVMKGSTEHPIGMHRLSSSRPGHFTFIRRCRL